MKSFKTYFTLTALVFSLSAAAADRSRDGGRYESNKNSRNHVQSNKHFKDNRKNINQKSYQGSHNSRKEVHNNKHRRGHSNNHRNSQHGHNNGFSGDYRNNRHFDNSNRSYHSNRYGNNHRNYGSNHRNYGHNNYNRGYISHNYYKPKKYYKKWKKQNRRYWKNKYRHFYNYNAYSTDQYRYQPLRGLGHYFNRQGYGYGHWHEGSWCRDHHDEYFYRNYYSYYPYSDGWRHGDGDFGIWFSFNL